MQPRWLAAGAGLCLCIGGNAAALGGPRITFVNTGLRLDYPTSQGLWGLAALAGAAIVAWAATRGSIRALAVLAALGSGLLATDRLQYHLEAGEAGLLDHGMTGSTEIRWREVRRVENGAALVLVWGGGDSQIRIVTSGLKPDERAVLDRTLARHVREAQEAAAPKRPQR